MSYTYQYPRPSVTVDTVIVAKPENQQQTKLLLIKRKNPPAKGKWALPGGFVDENEPLDKAAARELQEETSVNPSNIPLVQVGAFGDPGRDIRGWVVTVAYAALVDSADIGVKAADDAAEAEWFPVLELPALAFDHNLVIKQALRHLAKLEEAKAAGAECVEQLLRGADFLPEDWERNQE